MAIQHTFGALSTAKLASCAPRLAAVARRALEISPYDFTIVYGYRDQKDQDAAVAAGKSKTPWPTSMHNRNPSHAIDFAPIFGKVIPWDDTHIFAVVAGCFMAAGQELGTPIRWGGDWDADGSTKDQTLMDWGHVELAP
jgi:peptidoglycan L-alanyl-D-glutamate endopeptidase CwlK